MKFDMNRPEPVGPAGRPPEVGDVYPAFGGKGDSRYWLVVGVSRGKRVVVIGLDHAGAVVGAAAYIESAFHRRPLLGRCENIKNMNLEIDWIAS